MRPEESKFSRKISTLKGKNYKLKKKIEQEEPPADLDIDSLQAEWDKNEEAMATLTAERTVISDKIKVLFDQRDTLSASLERYASKGFLRGDFGISYTDSKKVSHRINEALYWTVIMNLIAIFLAYLISIPLGVNSAIWKTKGRKLIDNVNTTVLFVLYSLPNFWIGTLLLIFLTTSEYGEWLDWFPSSGAQDLELRDDPNASWFTKLLDVAHHLVLPVFCIMYGSLAYLSRQMRGAMLGVVRQDYIRTARAKGLSERRVIWKHAFRNSLFPIITMFGSVFPRALSGAIAIEMIYAIPGMGYLLLMSITARDWPVVFAIVMLIAVMAMIGNLIADILYAMVDPRVTY
jgi:peptide/nickel transport system permease protein